MKTNFILLCSVFVLGASMISAFGLDDSKTIFGEFIATEIGIGTILFLMYMWLVHQNYTYIKKRKSRIHKVIDTSMADAELNKQVKRAA